MCVGRGLIKLTEKKKMVKIEEERKWYLCGGVESQGLTAREIVVCGRMDRKDKPNHDMSYMTHETVGCVRAKYL